MLFIIGHMGLFVYTQKGSIISMVDLPTTEIIEPFFLRGLFHCLCRLLLYFVTISLSNLIYVWPWSLIKKSNLFDDDRYYEVIKMKRWRSK
ncbi:hypothetical protein CVO91_09850 [Streptococcus suis]|nr:hypothetical protein CVO91_09850 [Streptococcus suis]